MEIQYPEEFGIDQNGEPKLRIKCKCGEYAYQRSRRRKTGELHYYSCTGCAARVSFDPLDGIPRGTLADTETRNLRRKLSMGISKLKRFGLYEQFREKTKKRFIMIGYLGKKELNKLNALVEGLLEGSL